MNSDAITVKVKPNSSFSINAILQNTKDSANESVSTKDVLSDVSGF